MSKYTPFFKTVSGNIWNPRTSRNGLEYGSSGNNYYWNINNNAGATRRLCLANCTTFAYGRMLEAGCLPPVPYGFPDAMYWHNNLINGWTYVAYSFNAVEIGDILEWNWYNSGAGYQENHVAVVEKIENGTIYVSESYYTNRDETLTLQQISNWMIANYPNRFFNYGSMYSAYNDVPDLILKNPTSFTGSKKLWFVKKNDSRKRRIRYV